MPSSFREAWGEHLVDRFLARCCDDTRDRLRRNCIRGFDWYSEYSGIDMVHDGYTLWTMGARGRIVVHDGYTLAHENQKNETPKTAYRKFTSVGVQVGAHV